MHKSKEEAQEIIDKFFKAFPDVKNWIDKSIQKAHDLGYVEDAAGRRRRLPDAQLPKYSIKDNNVNSGSFNPFLGCKNRSSDSDLLKLYQDKLNKIKYAREYDKIQSEALRNNIEIHNNTGFIAQAERQAVNSIIQGSAASLTKSALIAIYNDPVLKNLGAYLVNTVHDEILIEAPEAVSEEAGSRLCELMIESAKKFINDVPMAADCYNVSNWYYDEYNVGVKKTFAKYLEKESLDIAFKQLCAEYCEMTPRGLYEIVKENFKNPPNEIDITSKDGVFFEN